MRRFAIAVLAILGSACAPGADVSTSPEHAVLVHLKLSDSGFGTEAEREALFELEQRLERAILAAAVGEFDGNEVGEGLCTLYMYGPNAETLFAAVAPVLHASPLARGATVIKRSGPPGSPEQRLEL